MSHRRRSVARRGRGRVTGLLGVVMAAVTALFTVYALSASADPNPNTHEADVSWVHFDNGADFVASRYNNMINELRTAAGHNFRNGVDITTTDTEGIVVLRATAVTFGPHVRTVRLYFTAADMYLRGWYPEGRGQLFQLQGYDLARLQGYDLARRLGVGDDTGPGSGGNQPDDPVQSAQVVTAGFDGTYGQLQRNANIDRAQLHYSAHAIANALMTLHNTPVDGGAIGDPRAVAQALLTMITTTSEAARFGGIAGTITAAMRGNTTTQMDTTNTQLTNNWDALSTYVRNITNNPNADPNGIDLGLPIGRITSFDQARHYLALAQSSHPPVL